MFGHSYFGARYFGPHYWGPAGTAETVGGHFGGAYYEYHKKKNEDYEAALRLVEKAEIKLENSQKVPIATKRAVKALDLPAPLPRLDLSWTYQQLAEIKALILAELEMMQDDEDFIEVFAMFGGL